MLTRAQFKAWSTLGYIALITAEVFDKKNAIITIIFITLPA